MAAGFGVLYLMGFFLFLTVVAPNRTPENQWMGFSDIIYVIYWRWQLDWEMMGGFLAMFFLATTMFSNLEKYISPQKLKQYGLPLILMVCNFVGMIAIDIGVTYFADVFIGGSWEGMEPLLFGMTAQRLYHTFFFWFMPSLIIIGYSLSVFLNQPKYRYINALKTFALMMSIFAITLAFLDSIVCASIGAGLENGWEWYSYGEWQMGDLWGGMWQGMWATGWITHYFIIAAFWLFFGWWIQQLFVDVMLQIHPDWIEEGKFVLRR